MRHTTRRTSAFRLSAILLVALAGCAVASCATGDGIDVEGGNSGDGPSGGPGGGRADGGGIFGSGGAGGDEGCEATESCDGIDNNCNGLIDEDCKCQAGAKQPCYTGAANTADVGACKKGEQTCEDGWGECLGQVLPSAEACNAIDDDCDGQVDEDLGTKTCGFGACEATVPSCENGAETTCESLPPSTEVCDGIDNNCNQLVDETYPEKDQACATGGQGVCGTGKSLCDAGELSCVPDGVATAEKCDGLDNDCDGAVDDVPGTGSPCSTGLSGACSEGITACSGNAIDCVAVVQPVAEACDGSDNNCDGQVDEGNPGGGGACMTGQPGACAAGIQKCVSGAYVCTPSAQSSPEQCNGIDDNCNGQADEGNPGAGAPCSTGKPGPCAAGTSTCSGGVPGCSQTVQPSAEVCGNGADEDCDGAPDDGCTPPCAHDKCSTGVALQSACDPCVTQVCSADPYCCTTSWDSTCVGEASSICGANCPSTCEHNECVTGVALTYGCSACATAVCNADDFCCDWLFGSWDGLCVSAAESLCGLNCP